MKKARNQAANLEDWEIWRPTHAIVITTQSGEYVEHVQAREVPGPAYTEAEWNSQEPADWEVDEQGNWTYQGATPQGNCEVEIRKI